MPSPADNNSEEQRPVWLQRAEQRLEQQREIHQQRHWLPRLALAAFGFLVLLTGLAMLVLPGPAVLVIPLGLGILSLEFAWARYLLQHSVRLSAGMRRHWKKALKVLLLLSVFFAFAALLAVLFLL